MTNPKEAKQHADNGFDVVGGVGVPKEVIAHVKENRVAPTSESSICVDGGYTPEQAAGELARPGADLGLSLALLKLGLSPQEAFSVVYDYRVSEGQKYGWHTDTHVDPEDGSEAHGDAICGCGHCNAAFQHSSYYGVETSAVTELLSIIKDHQAQHPENMRFINLDREHQEEGVFVVLDPSLTLLPWDLESGQQFFVYDKARDGELMTAIVEHARQSGAEVDVEALKQVVEDHTNATLGLLGSSKGKPLYAVKKDGGKVNIEKVGNAPSIDS